MSEKIDIQSEKRTDLAGLRPRDIRVRKTPRGRHLYYATAKGHGPYGWGNTPAEARAKLVENIRVSYADVAERA